MIRPPLLILAGAAVLAVAVTFWPGQERDIVAEGLLPASAGPRLASGAMEEPSSAARMTRFAGAGASVAADPAATVETSAPAPPPADALPVLVGVMGQDGRLTGYFSSNGLSIRARRGDMVDGWRVAALGRRDARLVKGRKVLNVALFSARSGPLSPAMGAPPPRSFASAAPAPDGGTIAPPPSGAPKAPRVRKPLPPLPKGSKGWWTGPPGEDPPPGYTRIPKLAD